MSNFAVQQMMARNALIKQGYTIIPSRYGITVKSPVTGQNISSGQAKTEIAAEEAKRMAPIIAARMASDSAWAAQQRITGSAVSSGDSVRAQTSQTKDISEAQKSPYQQQIDKLAQNSAAVQRTITQGYTPQNILIQGAPTPYAPAPTISQADRIAQLAANSAAAQRAPVSSAFTGATTVYGSQAAYDASRLRGSITPGISAVMPQGPRTMVVGGISYDVPANKSFEQVMMQQPTTRAGYGGGWGKQPIMTPEITPYVQKSILTATKPTVRKEMITTTLLAGPSTVPTSLVSEKIPIRSTVKQQVIEEFKRRFGKEPTEEQLQVIITREVEPTELTAKDLFEKAQKEVNKIDALSESTPEKVTASDALFLSRLTDIALDEAKKQYHSGKVVIASNELLTKVPYKYGDAFVQKRQENFNKRIEKVAEAVLQRSEVPKIQEKIKSLESQYNTDPSNLNVIKQLNDLQTRKNNIIVNTYDMVSKGMIDKDYRETIGLERSIRERLNTLQQLNKEYFNLSKMSTEKQLTKEEQDRLNELEVVMKGKQGNLGRTIAMIQEQLIDAKIKFANRIPVTETPTTIVRQPGGILALTGKTVGIGEGVRLAFEKTFKPAEKQIEIAKAINKSETTDDLVKWINNLNAKRPIELRITNEDILQALQSKRFTNAMIEGRKKELLEIFNNPSGTKAKDFAKRYGLDTVDKIFESAELGFRVGSPVLEKQFNTEIKNLDSQIAWTKNKIEKNPNNLVLKENLSNLINQKTNVINIQNRILGRRVQAIERFAEDQARIDTRLNYLNYKMNTKGLTSSEEMEIISLSAKRPGSVGKLIGNLAVLAVSFGAGEALPLYQESLASSEFLAKMPLITKTAQFGLSTAQFAQRIVSPLTLSMRTAEGTFGLGTAGASLVSRQLKEAKEYYEKEGNKLSWETQPALKAGNMISQVLVGGTLGIHETLVKPMLISPVKTKAEFEAIGAVLRVPGGLYSSIAKGKAIEKFRLAKTAAEKEAAVAAWQRTISRGEAISYKTAIGAQATFGISSGISAATSGRYTIPESIGYGIGASFLIPVAMKGIDKIITSEKRIELKEQRTIEKLKDLAIKQGQELKTFDDVYRFALEQVKLHPKEGKIVKEDIEGITALRNMFVNEGRNPKDITPKEAISKLQQIGRQMQMTKDFVSNHHYQTIIKNPNARQALINELIKNGTISTGSTVIKGAGNDIDLASGVGKLNNWLLSRQWSAKTPIEIGRGIVDAMKIVGAKFPELRVYGEAKSMRLDPYKYDLINKTVIDRLNGRDVILFGGKVIKEDIFGDYDLWVNPLTTSKTHGQVAKELAIELNRRLNTSVFKAISYRNGQTWKIVDGSTGIKVIDVNLLPKNYKLNKDFILSSSKRFVTSLRSAYERNLKTLKDSKKERLWGKAYYQNKMIENIWRINQFENLFGKILPILKIKLRDVLGAKELSGTTPFRLSYLLPAIKYGMKGTRFVEGKRQIIGKSEIPLQELPTRMQNVFDTGFSLLNPVYAGQQRMRDIMSTGTDLQMTLKGEKKPVKIQIHHGEWLRTYPFYTTPRKTTEGYLVTPLPEMYFRKLSGAFNDTRINKDLPDIYTLIDMFKKTPGGAKIVSDILSKKPLKESMAKTFDNFARKVAETRKSLRIGKKAQFNIGLVAREPIKQNVYRKVEYKKEPIRARLMKKGVPQEYRKSYAKTYPSISLVSYGYKVQPKYAYYKQPYKQKYTPYQPYQYKPYTPYAATYKPYVYKEKYKPYTPYTKYKPYTPYQSYTPYQPYTPYTPYQPYTPPPTTTGGGFGFGGGFEMTREKQKSKLGKIGRYAPDIRALELFAGGEFQLIPKGKKLSAIRTDPYGLAPVYLTPEQAKGFGFKIPPNAFKNKGGLSLV